MSPGEMVFTVAGDVATPARRVSLADAGLKERQHLQEWVIAHPQVLGPDVLVVSFEFGRWTGRDGGVERDRLDVLGLASSGELVVVELKRDKAPDTVEMQALKYAALASRFTVDDLAGAHAHFLSQRRGERVDVEQARAALEEWADLSDLGTKPPQLVLMASAFPRTVTSTVVFLHQQLGMTVRLITFQAYEVPSGLVLTVSQHYPPVDLEEFVLSPEVREERERRAEAPARRREANAVGRLVAAEAMEEGQVLTFRPPSATLREFVEPWLAEDPPRRTAQWRDDAQRPLVWGVDGEAYSPTALTRTILAKIGRDGAVQGPAFWVDADGQTLVEIAAALGSPAAVPLGDHLARMTEEQRRSYEALDNAAHELGAEVRSESKTTHIAYFGHRKLADLLVHGDHLSVYVKHLPLADAGDSRVVVSGDDSQVHTQIRTPDDVADVVALMRLSHERGRP